PTGGGATENEPQQDSLGETAPSQSQTESAGQSLDVFAAFGVQRDQTEDAEPATGSTGAGVTVDIDLPEREPVQKDKPAEKTGRGDRPGAEDDGEEGHGGEEAEDNEEAPRLPATALLFQAPDMTGPRRRGTTNRGAAADTAETSSEDEALRGKNRDGASSGAEDDDSDNGDDGAENDN